MLAMTESGRRENIYVFHQTKKPLKLGLLNQMITSITKALFMSKKLSESLAKDRATKKKHKTKIS